MAMYTIVIDSNMNGSIHGEGAHQLYNEGYGTLEGLTLLLDPLEVAYLAFKGKGEIVEDGKKVALEEFFSRVHSRDSLFWVKFTVYYDLRSRGRVVKPGFTSNSLLLYESKNTRIPAEMIVYVVEESSMFTLEKLLEWVEIAAKNDKTPILAVVDRHGDVTYYLMSRFTPVRIGD